VRIERTGGAALRICEDTVNAKIAACDIAGEVLDEAPSTEFLPHSMPLELTPPVPVNPYSEPPSPEPPHGEVIEVQVLGGTLRIQLPPGRK